MSQSAAEMHTYYAARAPYYDDVYLKPERQQDIAFLAAHLKSVFAGRQVLEVACGTGYWTQHIAATAHRVLATDGLAEPLAFARIRPANAQVLFEVADAYTLPPSLGVFDAAFAGLWFSHVPRARRSEFFRALHARLQPGATVVLLDNSTVQLIDHPLAETDPEGNTYQRRVLRDGSTHRVLKNFPSESELFAHLKPLVCGFGFRMLQNFWLLEYRLCEA